MDARVATRVGWNVFVLFAISLVQGEGEGECRSWRGASQTSEEWSLCMIT